MVSKINNRRKAPLFFEINRAINLSIFINIKKIVKNIQNTFKSSFKNTIYLKRIVKNLIFYRKDEKINKIIFKNESTFFLDFFIRCLFFTLITNYKTLSKEFTISSSFVLLTFFNTTEKSMASPVFLLTLLNKYNLNEKLLSIDTSLKIISTLIKWKCANMLFERLKLLMLNTYDNKF